MNAIRVTAAAVLLLFSMQSAIAQTAEQIIKKHVEVIGGASKWKGLKTIKYTGDFISDDGQKVLFSYTVSDDSAIRKDYQYAATGATASIVVTRTAGWAHIPQANMKTRPEAIPDISVKKLRYSLAVIDPLVDYKERGFKVSYSGKEKVRGVQTYRLKMEFKNEKDYVQYYFIDTSTYYTVQVSIRTNDEEMDMMHYLEYLKADDGRTYPSTFNEGAGLQYIRKVEVNVPLDEKTFIL